MSGRTVGKSGNLSQELAAATGGLRCRRCRRRRGVEGQPPQQKAAGGGGHGDDDVPCIAPPLQHDGCRMNE